MPLKGFKALLKGLNGPTIRNVLSADACLVLSCDKAKKRLPFVQPVSAWLCLSIQSVQSLPTGGAPNAHSGVPPVFGTYRPCLHPYWDSSRAPGRLYSRRVVSSPPPPGRSHQTLTHTTSATLTHKQRQKKKNEKKAKAKLSSCVCCGQIVPAIFNKPLESIN